MLRSSAVEQSAAMRQVGIIHTSYKELSKRNAGLVMAGVSALLNSWLCAIHCHKVCTGRYLAEWRPQLCEQVVLLGPQA